MRRDHWQRHADWHAALAEAIGSVAYGPAPDVDPSRLFDPGATS